METNINALKRILADTVAEVGRLQGELAASKEREEMHSAMRQEIHQLALKTTGELIDRVNQLIAQRSELAGIVFALTKDLEMWPGDKNPEYFDSMKRARAALAKLETEGSK